MPRESVGIALTGLFGAGGLLSQGLTPWAVIWDAPTGLALRVKNVALPEQVLSEHDPSSTLGADGLCGCSPRQASADAWYLAHGVSGRERTQTRFAVVAAGPSLSVPDLDEPETNGRDRHSRLSASAEHRPWTLCVLSERGLPSTPLWRGSCRACQARERGAHGGPPLQIPASFGKNLTS